MNLGEIYNAVFGALTDSKGNTRGVLHLINKEENYSTQITDEDKREIAGILPILGEIIRTADEASEISELSCCKNKDNNIFFDIALRQILDKIFDTLPSEETVRTLKLTK